MSALAPVTTDRVQRAIAGAAAATGTSFDTLYHQARLESALNPAAKAKTSSAAGLFQFTRGTWRGVVREHGAAHGLDWAAHAAATGTNLAAVDAMRFDPEVAALMAGEFTSDNADRLEQELGRPPEQVDLYLAHFLGSAGAVRFLRAHDADPNTPAASLFPAPAAANRSIFFAPSGAARSLGDIRALFAARLQGTAPPPPSSLAATLAARRPDLAQPLPAVEPPAPRPLQLAAIQPMPGRLSLDFAAQAYARVSGGGR